MVRRQDKVRNSLNIRITKLKQHRLKAGIEASAEQPGKKRKSLKVKSVKDRRPGDLCQGY